MKPTLNKKIVLNLSPTIKDKFEIVITRYKESLDWIQGIEHVCTIYNKGPLDLSLPSIQVPNHGHDAETILRHIITRYDSLADVTFFAQGEILDRDDQPLYPLSYYQTTGLNEIRGVTVDAYDPPKSRFLFRTDSPNTKGLTLGQWRSQVCKLPYRYLQEFWVRGDWIAVGRECIRKKPKEYYESVYKASDFERSVSCEELWFWERTFWAMFTSKLKS